MISEYRAPTLSANLHALGTALQVVYLCPNPVGTQCAQQFHSFYKGRFAHGDDEHIHGVRFRYFDPLAFKCEQKPFDSHAEANTWNGRSAYGFDQTIIASAAAYRPLCPDGAG